MPIVLALKCHNHETYCNSVILGEEEAHFRPGIRSFPGSSVLMYGRDCKTISIRPH